MLQLVCVSLVPRWCGVCLRSAVWATCCLSCLGHVTTSTARADYIVSNYSQWSGNNFIGSTANALFGETFTPPAGHTAIDGVTFWGTAWPVTQTNSSYPVQLDADVFTWTGSTTGKLVASAQYANPNYSSDGFPEFDFNFSPAQLVAGQQYLAVLRTVLPKPGFSQLGYIATPESLGGNAVLHGASGGSWNALSGDLVMEFHYVVPEPSTIALGMLSLLVFVPITLRSRRPTGEFAESKCL